jgi:hypothetical protein
MEKSEGARHEKRKRISFVKGLQQYCEIPEAGHGGKHVTHDAGTKQHRTARKTDARE